MSSKAPRQAKASSKSCRRQSTSSGTKKRQSSKRSSASKRSGVAPPVRAWKASIALLNDEEKLNGALTPRERKKIEENIHRLNGLITPHKRTFAVKARHPIACACLDYFREYGRPSSLATLFNWLEQQDRRSMKNAAGRKYVVSDTTLRRIIHETFGDLKIE